MSVATVVIGIASRPFGYKYSVNNKNVYIQDIVSSVQW